MDGPIRLGDRALAIGFQNDRNSQEHIELAYRRIELQATTENHSQDSVQVPSLTSLTTVAFASEIQG